MRYEITLGISDDRYVDSLVISLVRQGYDVYYNKDIERGIVCFTATDDDVNELEEK